MALCSRIVYGTAGLGVTDPHGGWDVWFVMYRSWGKRLLQPERIPRDPIVVAIMISPPGAD